MAPTIGQILASSYDAVINEMNQAANQWEESALLREFEKQKFLVRESLGNQIVHTLDYRRNPGAKFLATDTESLSTSKTEVLTEAQYAIGEIAVPIRWTNKDEVRTPSVNAKIKFVNALMRNAKGSHDDLMEESFFASSTQGWLGMASLIPASGLGNPGGVDATTEVYWRNESVVYVDDTDIDPALTTAWNAATKGSGSSLMPTLATSDAETQALFEGTLTPNQRYIDVDEARLGFKVLAVKTARWVFSKYGGSTVYLANPRNLKVIVSKEYFRAQGERKSLEGTPGSEIIMYSAGNTTTNNKSRLSQVHV